MLLRPQLNSVYMTSQICVNNIIQCNETMDDYVINNIRKTHESFYHSFEAACKLQLLDYSTTMRSSHTSE